MSENREALFVAAVEYLDTFLGVGGGQWVAGAYISGLEASWTDLLDAYKHRCCAGFSLTPA